MKLDQAFLNEAHERLATLTKERGRLNSELEECERLIEALGELLGDAQLDQSPKTAAKVGFAERIRRCLASAGKAMSPKQVADAICTDGFEWHKSYPIVTAVNVELHRMAKSKNIPVKKAGRGFYRMLEEKPKIKS